MKEMEVGKIKRKTKFIVYVGESVLDKPDSLFDAAYAHLVKKDYPIGRRKEFMALYMKAVGKEAQRGVVDAWVQVRDVATFPMRRVGVTEEDQPNDTPKAGIDVGKAAVALRKVTKKLEETSEDTETEGGVSLDDGADGEQKSGAASK